MSAIRVGILEAVFSLSAGQLFQCDLQGVTLGGITKGIGATNKPSWSRQSSTRRYLVLTCPRAYIKIEP